jgi:peroxiredoxin
MRLFLVSLTLSGLLATVATADVTIGEKLKPFALTDATSGKPLDMSKAQGKKATVLIFVSTQCPVSNGYNERMTALAQDYLGKGVVFVGLNANREETPDEIADHAKKHGLPFPVLKDVHNVQADAFGAKVTPEAYLYDADGKLRYHGRIDDDRAGSNVQSKDLKNAIEAVLSGKEVAVSETKAFGCTIKREAKSAQ